MDVVSPKQQDILDATLELLGEHGFHGTPISAISKKANVGSGTIYRYYDSKEDLINALYIREKQAMTDRIMKDYDPDMPTLDAIRMIWTNGIKTVINDKSSYRFLVQYYNSPFITDETRRSREKMMQGYVNLIEQGIKRGELKKLSPMAHMIMIFSPLMGLTDNILSGDISEGDSIFDELLDAVWSSVKA